MIEISKSSRLRSLKRELARGGKRGIEVFVDEDGEVVIGNEQPVLVALGQGINVMLRVRNPWSRVGRGMPLGQILYHRRHRWQNTVLAEVRAQRAMEASARQREKDDMDRDRIEEARRVIDEVITVSVP